MTDRVSNRGFLAAFSDELAAAVARAAPSVVRIEGRVRRGQGTGVVWAEGGLVVTADHVVERTEEVTIGMDDGSRVAGTIIGRDSNVDVALVRGTLDGVPPIERGPRAKVGNLVLALGRPGAGIMATVGVVNATGDREGGARRGRRSRYVHTDALLYPGFSGGPLLDSAGGMIGLNSSRDRSGAGVAIDLEVVTRTVEALQAGGRVQRGYLGVTTQPVTLPQSLREKLDVKQTGGLLISSIEEGAPAEAAGLLIGDILLTLGGETMEDNGDLRSALGLSPIGQAAAGILIRGGELREIALVIAERE